MFGSVEQIKVGDKVLSYDQKTKQFEYKTVVQSFTAVKENIVKIKIRGEKLLTTTTEHPFYVKKTHKARDGLNAESDDEEGEWLTASELEVGQRVLRPDGKWTRITSISYSTEPTLVYNLEVEGNHNYFVGEIGVLSHNCGKTIALGVRENLGEFAKNVGGETYHVWGKENFQTQFLEVINNVNNKIHFNLTGPDGEMINVWKAIIDPSKATNWELLQLYQNKEALARTTFYYNGRVIANPFGN